MNRKWVLVGLVLWVGAILVVGLSACSASTPTPAAGSPRVGTLSDITGTVDLRTDAAGTFASAKRGTTWYVGAQVRTGDNSLARLDLADGISLRLGPNGLLTNKSQPAQWQIELERGILWVTLYGRPLNVSTALGQVSAVGTAATFKYLADPSGSTGSDMWIIECLRATCQYQDNTQAISLAELGQLIVAQGGASVQQSMTSRAEVDEFIANNPEASGLLVNQRAAAPVPSSTPLTTPSSTASPLPGSNAAASLTAQAMSSPTPTPSAMPSQTPPATVTPTPTITWTPTSTRRPTLVWFPWTRTPTFTPSPTDTDTPEPSSSSGGGGGGGGGGQPSSNPAQPPAPTSPPQRTSPPKPKP